MMQHDLGPGQARARRGESAQITIRDVAARAGVNPSTVSRVLTANRRISEETRNRVLKVIAELDYHPNVIGRNLASRDTRTIGLMIARPVAEALANPFFVAMTAGVSSVLQREGYNLLLSLSETAREERSACLSLLRGGQVDGVILTSSRVRDPVIGDLESKGSPYVIVGRLMGNPHGNTVNNDNVGLGRMVTDYLLGLGHRRVAIITGPSDLVVSRDRVAGYRQALDQAGCTLLPEYEVQGDFSQESGYRAMNRLLGVLPAPTAVFATDDVMAIGALQCLHDREIPVPHRISVVGVNDDPRGPYLTPPLTTVHIPIFDMGVMAATRLLQVLRGRGGSPGPVILPGNMVVRASTAPPPREGE